MGDRTGIEWADSTFNPWVGCTKVSPACDHCYAEWWAKRTGSSELWNGVRRRTTPENWNKPLKWNANGRQFFLEHGRRQRVFCASLADVFDNAVPDDWRADLWKLIAATPNLDWLLLTKRIGNAARMGMTALDNIWLGATVVNQEEADRDIPKLLATPARVRFLSMEPLLGSVNLSAILTGPDDHAEGYPRSVDWVIVGGESGRGARPMHPDWVRELRYQCAAARVPFFFKQWGEWEPRDQWSGHRGGGRFEPMLAVMRDGSECPHDAVPQDVGAHRMARVGTKAAGRTLDGLEHSEFPSTKCELDPECLNGRSHAGNCDPEPYT